MEVRAWVFSAACGAGLLLSGCGGGSVAPQQSALAGNWLIVGPMPANQLLLPPVTSGFSLAMTFDVTGNNIVGAGFVNAPCQSESSSSPIFGPSLVTFPTAASGTVAADGSFSVQTSRNPVGSISIQGKTPQASGGEWPGSYTASISTIGAACTGSSEGTVTATSFPLINGVYAGPGSLQTIVNGVSGTTPVTFQATLQQGGTLVDSTTGKASFSNLVLTGSIRVQGAPCFTSGVMTSSPRSAVEGNQVVAAFAMDDGSTLSIVGTVTDAREARITTNVAIVNGGQCDKNFYQLPELDRQNWMELRKPDGFDLVGESRVFSISADGTEGEVLALDEGGTGMPNSDSSIMKKVRVVATVDYYLVR